MNKEELLNFIKGLPEELFEALPTGTVLSPVIPPEVLRFTTGAKAIIEATKNEQFLLWETYGRKEDVYWVSDNNGYGVTVGYIGKLPICLAINRANVNGRKILFYTVTSRVVDYEIVEQWLNINFPSVLRSDATNAGNLILTGG